MKTLDTTSYVPLPFECFYAARVEDIDFVERQLHEQCSELTVYVLPARKKK